MPIDFSDLLAATEKPSLTILDLDPAAIDEDPDQPRRSYDPEAMAVLVQSIRVHGLKSPISVCDVVDGKGLPTGRYLVNYGHRRLRAVKELALKTVPAIVGERDGMDVQITENIAREDLSPLDLARGFAVLRDSGLSHAQIGEKTGYRKERVTRQLALLDLPAPIQDVWNIGLLSNVKAAAKLSAMLEAEPERIGALIAGSVDQGEAISRTVIELWEGKPEPARARHEPSIDPIQEEALFDNGFDEPPKDAEQSEPEPEPVRLPKSRKADQAEAEVPLADEAERPGAMPAGEKRVRLDVVVEFEGEVGTILLGRLPEPGRLWITLDREVMQVPIEDVTLKGVFEK